MSVTVTALDTVTVFEGNETIYRYDLPAAGILDGWALDAVIEQITSLIDDDQDPLVVSIDAETEVDAKLRRALSARGISGGSDSDDTGRIPAPEPPEAPGGRHRLKPTAARRGPVAVVVIAVLLVIGASWWVIGSTRPATTAEPPTTEASTAKTPEPPASSASPMPPAPPPPVIHEHEDLRFATPPEHQVDSIEDTVRVTGPDPGVRILLASDPVSAESPQQLFDEMRASIENDPTLTKPVQADGRLTYMEVPGDGSEVRWTTWIEANQQVSAGCHTQHAATPEQLDTCRVTTESLSISAS